MQGLTLDVVDPGRSGSIPATQFRVGRIIQITPKGRPLVDFPGNQLGPVEARVACAAPSNLDEVNCREKGVPALLMFESGDIDYPIVVGLVQDTFQPPAPVQTATIEAQGPRQARVDGKVIVFDASEEISLRCGKSSVTMRKDGKVVVKGTHIVTRATGKNRIKGGSVTIN